MKIKTAVFSKNCSRNFIVHLFKCSKTLIHQKMTEKKKYIAPGKLATVNAVESEDSWPLWMYLLVFLAPIILGGIVVFVLMYLQEKKLRARDKNLLYPPKPVVKKIDTKEPKIANNLTTTETQ